MRKEQNILHKGVAIFFIGLITFMTVHIYLEYHSDNQVNQNHHCILCHQAMIEPTPTVFISEPFLYIKQKVFTNTQKKFIKKITYRHLFARGPPSMKFT